jgi:hypothetical protein
MALHQDFVDLLAALASEDVSYLLVGGYAVAFHSRPRFTKDIDIWIDPDPVNVERTARALTAFGAPPAIIDALRTSRDDEIVYMGNPPVRVDLFKSLPGVGFASCYGRRVVDRWEDVPVSVIGLPDLIAAKRASDRPQDRLDIELLEQARRVPEE